MSILRQCLRPAVWAVAILTGLVLTARAEDLGGVAAPPENPSASTLLQQLYPDMDPERDLGGDAGQLVIHARKGMDPGSENLAPDADTSPTLQQPDMAHDRIPYAQGHDREPMPPPVSLNLLHLAAPLTQPVLIGPPMPATARYSVVTTTPGKAPEAKSGLAEKNPAAKSAKVQINHAGIAELERKLKIDARRARLIIEFREAYGPFKRTEDLTQVFGITDEMLVTWENGDQLVLD